MRPKDNQRGRVYHAEYETFGKRFPLREDELQNYVDSILATRWWKSRFPHIRSIECVAVRGGTSRGDPWNRRITIGKDNRYKWVVLHEISHVPSQDDQAWHGPEFVDRYLCMVDEFLGHNDFRALRSALRKAGAKRRKVLHAVA